MTHEWRGKREGGEYKEKYRDGDCRVECEGEDGKYKEERECKEKASIKPIRRVQLMCGPDQWWFTHRELTMNRVNRFTAQAVNQGDVYGNSESVGRVIGGIAVNKTLKYF